MKKIKVFETFSGIGAQHSALSNLKSKGILDYEVVGTSEWDVYAVQSYAAIHCKDYEKMEDPSEQELHDFLKSETFSTDGKKPNENIYRYHDELHMKWYKAYKATKNVGSIVDSFKRVTDNIHLKGERIDLLTYSFPCQDLSSAGNFHGFNEGIKKHTRSGLLFEIEKLLDKMSKHQVTNKKLVKAEKDSKNLLPKYLLLENVVNLVQVKHKADFDKWLKKLEKLGYKTIWGIVNSHDFNMAQARRRVYALSIYDPNNKIKWDGNVRSDLSDVLVEQFNNEYKPKYKYGVKEVFDFENKETHESVWAQIKNTPSRIRMINSGKDLNEEGMVKVPTVTTKQDRLPNVGSLIFKNPRKDAKGVPYTNHRFITPMEAYLLMGFTKSQYVRAKKDMIRTTRMSFSKTESSAREKLYKQAGNSICVNVLEEIFYLANKY